LTRIFQHFLYAEEEN